MRMHGGHPLEGLAQLALIIVFLYFLLFPSRFRSSFFIFLKYVIPEDIVSSPWLRCMTLYGMGNLCGITRCNEFVHIRSS